METAPGRLRARRHRPRQLHGGRRRASASRSRRSRRACAGSRPSSACGCSTASAAGSRSPTPGRAFEGPARRLVRERALVLDAVGAVRALDTGTLDLVSLPDARGRSARARSSAASASRIRASSCASPSPKTRRGVEAASPTAAASSASRCSRRGATTSSRSRSRARRSSRCARRARGCPRPAGCRSRALADMPLIATPPRHVDARPARPGARVGRRHAPRSRSRPAQREAIAPLVLGGAGTSFLPRADRRGARRAGDRGRAPRRPRSCARSASCTAPARSRPRHARSSSSPAPSREARSGDPARPAAARSRRPRRAIDSLGDVGAARVVPAPRGIERVAQPADVGDVEPREVVDAGRSAAANSSATSSRRAIARLPRQCATSAAAGPRHVCVQSTTPRHAGRAATARCRDGSRDGTSTRLVHGHRSLGDLDRTRPTPRAGSTTAAVRVPVVEPHGRKYVQDASAANVDRVRPRATSRPARRGTRRGRAARGRRGRRGARHHDRAARPRDRADASAATSAGRARVRCGDASDAERGRFVLDDADVGREVGAGPAAQHESVRVSRRRRRRPRARPPPTRCGSRRTRDHLRLPGPTRPFDPGQRRRRAGRAASRQESPFVGTFWAERWFTGRYPPDPKRCVDVPPSRQGPRMPDRRRGAARPPEPSVRRARAPLRARHAARAAVPRGARAGHLRHGLFLGRGAQVLGGATACTRPRSATRAASRRTRRTKRCARVAPVTPRPCSSCSTRRSRRTTRCCACSGRTTTRRRACARATTSARSTARRSTRSATRRRPRPRRRATMFQAAAARRGLRRRSRPRSRAAPTFYYAEDYHQQYLAKNPTGTAASAAPA